LQHDVNVGGNFLGSCAAAWTVINPWFYEKIVAREMMSIRVACLILSTYIQRRMFVFSTVSVSKGWDS
jgi:hypothetical protein